MAVAAFADARRSFDFKHFGIWDTASRRVVAMEISDARLGSRRAYHGIQRPRWVPKRSPSQAFTWCTGRVDRQAAGFHTRRCRT